MLKVIELREKLRAFYGKHDIIMLAIIKFLLAFTSLMFINLNIGYRAVLTNPFIVIILSLVCSVVPYGVITALLAMVVLAHIISVSLEMALVCAVFLMAIAILYYGFHPRNSYIMVITPLLFVLKVPYVIPLIAGLAGSMIAVIPISCGVVLYYMLEYVKTNAGTLTNDASVDITQKYMGMINSIISNKLMLITILAFAATTLAVCIIRNVSADYAWVVSIAVGALIMLVVTMMGSFVYSVDVHIIGLILSIAISTLIAYIYYFFAMAVDYSRTEYTQFEDEAYYYYVKAIPKISVTATDIKVQKISSARKRGRRSSQEA